MGHDGLIHSYTNADSVTHARVDRSPREPGDLWAGTGKTFFLEALGQLAVEAGLKVAWFSLEELGVPVRRHRADDSVTRAVQAILRARLIVVDDIGLLPSRQM